MNLFQILREIRLDGKHFEPVINSILCWKGSDYGFFEEGKLCEERFQFVS